MVITLSNTFKLVNNKKTERVFFALFNRGIGLLLQFLLNIIIAQLFGPAGMGIYHIYTTWMVILSDIASLGLPIYTMRKITSLAQKVTKNNQYYLINIYKLVKHFLLLSIISSFLVSGVFITLSQFISEFFLDNHQTAYVLVYAAIAAIFFLMIRILVEAIKALGYTNTGLLAESSLLALALIISLFVLSLYAQSYAIEDLLKIHLITLPGVFIIMFFLIKQKIIARYPLDTKIKSIHKGLYKQILSHKSLWFIWISTVLNVCFINLPIFVLPQIASTDEIGLFGVSFRLVMLSTTILVSLSALFGPRFVKYYQQNDCENLKQELQHSQCYSLIAYGPFLIIFTLFPVSVLTLFGNEFKQATSILIILALAQLVNSATGLVGYFLIMIEHEKAELMTLIFSSAVTLPLMFILGNSDGVIGVTLAYAIGISLKNILSLFLAYYFINKLKRKKR